MIDRQYTLQTRAAVADALVRRTIPGALVKQLGERQMLMRLSTDDVDLTRDRIPLSAWKRLPERVPLLWGHQHDALPLGYVEPYLQRDALYGRVVFAPKGLHPLADQVHDLTRAGILTDCSVGFQAEDPQRNAHGGFTYGTAHLMELSIVSIGANPFAKVVQASASPALQQWLIAKAVPALPRPPQTGASPMAGEVRVTGGSGSDAVHRSWSTLLASHRGPAAPVDKGGPEDRRTKAAVQARIEQGIRDELAILLLQASNEAYAALREREQWLRRSW